jgi:hypothetical protein
MSYSHQTYFSFPESDLNLDCGLHDHVIMRVASLALPNEDQSKEAPNYEGPYMLCWFMTVSQKQSRNECTMHSIWGSPYVNKDGLR